VKRWHPHHGGPHDELGHRLPMHGRGRIRHFVGARLHRRLFWLMGLAIIISFGAAFAVLHAFSGRGHDWEGRQRALVTFAADRFADVWHEPHRRDRLADEAAKTFGVRLTLKDVRGQVLSQAGGSCTGPWATLDVKRAGSAGGRLGQVAVCGGPDWGPGRYRFAAAFVTAAMVLWMFSGLIARRLGKPLWQLVGVTQAIGSGDLSARARLGRHQPGEVGALAHSINDMAERIERQVKGQKELLAGVSHEIRTPLARLRVLTEILRDHGTDEKLLRSAELEIEEIDDLTGRLLASSRLDFDGIDLRAIDARDLAATALERAGLPAELLAVELENTTFQGDPTLLQRALANLLANAKTYGGGVRRLLVHERTGLLCFSVEDAGPGFAQGDLARVFKPFVRGAKGNGNASDVGPSLGLGLHLVQRIAQAHGGTAEAENLEAGGARVTVGVRR
jgi:two-component system OmpR family sensor kinase